MALGKDKTTLWLKSGDFYRGVWANAELIGTDATRPRDHFSGVIVGNIKAETQVTNLTKEFVEALSGTPRELIRKDVIRQPFEIVGNLFEQTGDSLSIFMNRTAQLAYSVTIPATEDWDIIHIGGDGPALTEDGVLIRALDVNDREVEIAMYAGLNTPEDQAVDQSGSDYSIVSIKYEATPLVAQIDHKKNYGYLGRRVA